jgi:hypothetical protein
VSNRPKPLWLRVTVVSVGGKVRGIPVLVGVKETSESKPSDDASLGSSVVKTRGEWNFWEKPVGSPEYWAGGDRRKGGVNLTQAFIGTAGTSRSNAKGEAQMVEAMRRAYRCGALGRTDPYEL